jgi:beta-lactamase regulating signal transducer with metallopeptidase domain
MQEFLGNRFLPLLLKASWQASVIIVLVLAAQYGFGRRWNPRWRHALWWLVVARLALPLTIPSPVSLFNIFPHPTGGALVSSTVSAPNLSSVGAAPPLTGTPRVVESVSAWLGLWTLGALSMTGCLGVGHFRILRSVKGRRPLIDEQVLNLLEDCKQQMCVCVPVTLVETTAVDGPCLFGLLRPRLLLPPGFTHRFSHDELRYVFLHELAHVKRHDIFLGWLTALLQILHWFNPLVWLAFARLRVDRELACDALALSYAEGRDNKPYGQTIVKLLENFGNAPRAPSLAGIVEDKQRMKERIIMIAKFQKTNRGLAVASVLMAGLAVVTLTDGQSGANPPTASSPDSNGQPQIISTSPMNGVTDVDPALTEITVTFDRDMGGGMSWVGGGPDFPKSPQDAKARWQDKRTCVLPVILQAGRYYRVGINSQSYQNFRGVNGVPANPSAVYFTTQGASEALQRRVKAPIIMSLNPPNGARDVSAAVTELRVSFNVPMGRGMSWTGGGPGFPGMTEGKKAYWTDGGKTCVLPVELKPGTEYELGLNSPSYNNFQSAAGVPLAPVDYTFKTADKQ